MHRTLTRLAALLIALGSAPLAAQTAPAGPPESEEATLMPGDAVKVLIWREEELSGEFPVDATGRVTLPLLGDLMVTGMHTGVLRDSLIVLYRQQLRNPSITVTPLRRINVLGEVNKPGLYPVDPTITLAGAVAIAGGASSEGDIQKILVFRQGESRPERVSSLSRLDRVRIRSGDQIVVQRRNWFDRNSALVVSMLLSATSIVVTLIR